MARDITREINEGTRVWKSTNQYEISSLAIYWARCNQHAMSFHASTAAVRDAWADEHDATRTHLFPIPR